MCRRWTDAVQGDRDLYVDATVILWFNIRSCILVLHVCVCVLKVPFRIPSDVPGDVVLSLWYLPQRPRCGEPATLASGSSRRQRLSATFARPPTSQKICTCRKDCKPSSFKTTCKTVDKSCHLPDLNTTLCGQLPLPTHLVKKKRANACAIWMPKGLFLMSSLPLVQELDAKLVQIRDPRRIRNLLRVRRIRP